MRTCLVTLLASAALCAGAKKKIDWKLDAATANAAARKANRLLMVFITGPKT